MTHRPLATRAPLRRLALALLALAALGASSAAKRSFVVVAKQDRGLRTINHSSALASKEDR